MCSDASKFLPLFLVFISGLCFSIQTLIVKLYAPTIGTYLIMIGRGSLQLIVTTFMFISSRNDETITPLFANTYTTNMLILRSIIGYFGMVTSFYAIERLPIGDATTLIMLSPTISSFLGVFILHEPWHIFEMISGGISIIGVALVTRPCFGLFKCEKPIDALGVVFALSAAFTTGVVYITLRILGTTASVPWYHITLFQSVFIILLSIPAMFILEPHIHQSFDMSTLKVLIFSGVVGTIGQVSMTVGLQREKSAMGTAMRSSDIIFGFVLQALFTQEVVSPISLIGAACVLCSIVIIVIKKQMELSSVSGVHGITPLDIENQQSDIGHTYAKLSIAEEDDNQQNMSSDLSGIIEESSQIDSAR